MPTQRFVLLDRDGTLIVDHGYLADPVQVELLPHAVIGLRRLRQLGCGLVILTNQSGIARGKFDERQLAAVHERLWQLLQAEGIELDAIYVCPHGPDDGCACRKPRTGLVEQAARDFDFCRSHCFLIGDKPCDIELGHAIGATTFQIVHEVADTVQSSTPHYRVHDLAEAAHRIEQLLGSEHPPRRPHFTMQSVSNSRDRFDSVMREHIRTHLLASAQVKQQTAESATDAILAAADLIATSFRQGGKLLLCGNGGSAADCQHLAAEFTNRLSSDFPRPGLPAIALTTDTSFLTAYANDFEFEGIFSRLVQSLGKPRDVLLGISTSGNSPNILRAFETARASLIKTIALTGRGGRLRELADVTIGIPSDNTQHIQEAHLAVEHLLCALVERAIFPELIPLAEKPCVSSS